MTFTVGFLLGLVWGALGGVTLAVLGRDWIARRATYRLAVEEMRRDPVIREMAADARRRAEMRRFVVLRGGLVERGPFALKSGRRA